MTTSSSSKRALPCFIALMIITLASGLVLGATYLLTESRISAQAAAAAESSRAGVLPEAARFESADDSEWLSENALDWLYLGYDENGALVGAAAQKTVNGYGGRVEIIAGIRTDGTISGVSVGGSEFSETAGLGAKSKEPAFTDQFSGKVYGINAVKRGDDKGENDVDAITSATITSRAVTGGINEICKAVTEYLHAAPAQEGGAA
ncbi:MAG: FMN-binding protein [Clostridia bacterium]|nr:FMN-binding protein [Clostridia bacterium]